mgnify:FL=1
MPGRILWGWILILSTLSLYFAAVWHWTIQQPDSPNWLIGLMASLTCIFCVSANLVLIRSLRSKSNN